VFLLYEQPADFTVSKHAPAGGKEVGIMGRVRWNLGKFEKEAGLGTVVAANYFKSS
jgi:phosphatidylethanolamine-binding protein